MYDPIRQRVRAYRRELFDSALRDAHGESVVNGGGTILCIEGSPHTRQHLVDLVFV
jgi:hypothetical protein